MPTVIEGVRVANPTAVWMQLMNTRHNVLNQAEKWNNGGWFDQGRGAGGWRPFTMCLANAVRFVTRGTASEPQVYSRERLEMDEAEAILLKAIVKAAGPVGDIPDYNDAARRRYEEIVAVLDTAIKLVEPFARKIAMVYADDVMTPEEKLEIDRAVIRAENEIWQEQRVKWGIRLAIDGTWRRSDGKFAAVPDWVRNDAGAVEPLEPLPAVRVKGFGHVKFGQWIKSHEERGWDPFWDELLTCDEQDPHYDSCVAAKKALTHA